MYLQLYQIKKHLNIDDNFHKDDEYLVELGQSAEDVVQTHLDRPLKDLENEEGFIPSSLQQAMLQLVATWYASRESVSYASCSVLPHAYDYIIALYKNYNSNSDDSRAIK